MLVVTQDVVVLHDIAMYYVLHIHMSKSGVYGIWGSRKKDKRN